MRFIRPLWRIGLLVLLVSLGGAAHLSQVARGQTTATLRGIVTASDDGTALQGANVVLFTMADSMAQATATNVDGYYQLEDVPPGRYRFRVSFIGFETHQDTLTLTPGTRRVNVPLAPGAQTLEEVRVEAERGAAQRNAGLQTVSAADLGRIPTPGPSGDLAAYLQTLPGVVSTGDRGGQLYIRGGTPSQNLVLVDGMPIIKPFHISGLYSAFSEEVVKSADIYAGGFSAEYMGRLSSVIDITLRQGNMKQTVGSASVSPFLVSARLEGPVKEDTTSFLGVVRHSVIENVSESIYGRRVPLTFYDLTGRYSLQKENASCSLTGIRTHDEGQINAERNTVLTWSNTVLGGRCLIFGESLDHALEVSGGYTRFENAAGTEAAPERSASVQKGHFSAGREQDFLGGTLDLGAQFMYTKYGYDLGEKFTALRTADTYTTVLMGHAAMTWDVGDYLTLEPSIGSQLSSKRQTPTIEPRFRMSYRPDGTGRQEISLAVGKYNQVAEGITDERDAGTVFTVWVPSSRTEPSLRALHGILGYQQQIGSSVEVSIEGYGKTMSNIPVPRWTPVARLNTRTTPADGLSYGADIRVSVDTDPFYLFLGYGWSKVTYEAAQEDLGAWLQGEIVEYTPPHDRRHQLNLVGSYEFGNFTANLNWQLGSGRPYTQVYGFDLSLDLVTLEEFPSRDPGTALTLFDEPYGARLPTYHRLDLSLSHSLDLSSSLSLITKVGAINVYDRQNVFYYDVNTLDRVNQTPVLPYASVRVRLD